MLTLLLIVLPRPLALKGATLGIISFFTLILNTFSVIYNLFVIYSRPPSPPPGVPPPATPPEPLPSRGVPPPDPPPDC